MKTVNKLIIALIVVLFCFIGIHFLTKTDEQKAVNVDINNELLEDSVGVGMSELDYASQKYVIFHDYYGLFVYDIENRLIYRALDLKYYDMDSTNGDQTCNIYFDNNYIYLSNGNKTMRYNIHKNTIKRIDSLDNLSLNKSIKNTADFEKYIPDYKGNEGMFSSNSCYFQKQLVYLKSETLLIKDIELVIDDFVNNTTKFMHVFDKNITEN